MVPEERVCPGIRCRSPEAVEISGEVCASATVFSRLSADVVLRSFFLAFATARFSSGLVFRTADGSQRNGLVGLWSEGLGRVFARPNFLHGPGSYILY